MLTHKMLAYVRCLMMAADVFDRETPLFARLERIESYLIARYIRDA
jgi:hypothetical protein